MAEDGSIGLQKICALHSRPSRSCPHQDGIVSVLEGHLRISCRYDLLKQRIGAILELQDLTIENILGLWQLEQLQNDILIGSKHCPLSNEVRQETSDCAGSPCHSNSHGSGRLGLTLNHNVYIFLK